MDIINLLALGIGVLIVTIAWIWMLKDMDNLTKFYEVQKNGV